MREQKNLVKENKMKNRNIFIASIMMVTAVAGMSLAFADSKQAKETTPYDLRGRDPKRMAKTKMEVTAISTGIDALMVMVKEASASNNKSKMKTALDASQKHLAAMKMHADHCNYDKESMDSEMSKQGHNGKAMSEKGM